MRKLSYDLTLELLECPKFESISDKIEGRILNVGTTLVRAHLPNVGLGELCTLPNGGLAEVVSIEGNEALLSPYNEPIGLSNSMFVSPQGKSLYIRVGEHLLGRVINALAQPIDGEELSCSNILRDIDGEPPNPMQRSIIDKPISMGVKAIDTMLTVGRGQRLGIFAPAGCGKSTLLGMLATNSEAEIIILALIGERGREVREFLENILTPELRARSIIIVATSDRPALERVKAAATATTIAEYFRDQGIHVLLLVDSLTRYARAIREIALASGEPIVGGGYPPSLYARLPRLLERAGPSMHGSITAFYTILMEDHGDPLAEEVRSLLDGHIVLSRRLAEVNHYPAIDILSSISRVMNQITSDSHKKEANRLRKLLSSWQEIELLLRVGEYQKGNNFDADDAIERKSKIECFLQQGTSENYTFEQSLKYLHDTLS